MNKSYDINKLTHEELRDLIASANDNFDNQIRVTEEGQVFISRTVGAQSIEGLRFRFETFDAGNGYVGSNAANDSSYVAETYNALKKCWDQGETGYIDYYLMI